MDENRVYNMVGFVFGPAFAKANHDGIDEFRNPIASKVE